VVKILFFGSRVQFNDNAEEACRNAPRWVGTGVTSWYSNDVDVTSRVTTSGNQGLKTG
jgi:hypothetical protein